jgi:hypothetical protein
MQERKSMLTEVQNERRSIAAERAQLVTQQKVCIGGACIRS